jgi:hypothetical protein
MPGTTDWRDPRAELNLPIRYLGDNLDRLLGLLNAAQTDQETQVRLDRAADRRSAARVRLDRAASRRLVARRRCA